MSIGTKYFKKADFWARELRLPLFWMTDPGHEIFKRGILVFYKNNVLHVYYLDDLGIKAAEKGYKFFTDKFKAASYKKQVGKIRDLIKRAANNYGKLKIKKITDAELKKNFLELIGFLDSYSNVYTKTEPIVLSKIESDEKKHKKLIKELGYLRLALRKEGEPLFYYLLGVFLKEIAKRADLKTADLFFYKFDELAKLFEEQKVGNSVIEKRKRGYALICLKDKKVLLTGKEFKVLYKNIVLSKPKADHLMGQTAMKGKVRGKVKVVLHNRRNIMRKIADFKQGEILVTEMTRPDTILACEKAAAIITDEGGITSHAAIISRELKIPCVIATKVATRLLKTGDWVEVDADKGLVKILKNK